MKIKLTDKDSNTLCRALRLVTDWDAGIYGNYNHMEKLERHGLFKREGRTEGFCDIDGNEIGDRYLWGLTSLGKAVAERLNVFEPVELLGFIEPRDPQ